MNPDHIFIRHIRIDDLDQIQKFCFEQLSQNQDPMSQIRISERQYAWEMKRLRQDWLAQQCYIAYIAEDKTEGDAKIVGYGAAVITHQPHCFSIETIAALGELWVVPEYRGIGIGKGIVSAIMEELKNIGIDWISVHLGGNEVDTEAFFHKLGFSTDAIEVRKCLVLQNPSS